MCGEGETQKDLNWIWKIRLHLQGKRIRVVVDQGPFNGICTHKSEEVIQAIHPMAVPKLKSTSVAEPMPRPGPED